MAPGQNTEGMALRGIIRGQEAPSCKCPESGRPELFRKSFCIALCKRRIQLSCTGLGGREWCPELGNCVRGQSAEGRSRRSTMRVSLRVLRSVTRKVFLGLNALILGTALISPTGLVGQATGGSPTTPNVTLPGPPNPFLGSDAQSKATPEVLQIDYTEAINRGLRYNLGLLLASDATETARGERWKQLSDLLPNLSGRVQENAQTLALAALGFNKLFPLFEPAGSASNLPRVVPAFNYFDARATLSQSVFNFNSLEKERSAAESVRAAQFTYKDAREMVVLAVGNAYLQ